MLYQEYITKAKQICIAIDDERDIAYLIPEYKYLLTISEMTPDIIEDFNNVSFNDIGETLKLNVSLYNQARDKTKELIDLLYDALNMAMSSKDQITQAIAVKDMLSNIQNNKEKKNNQKNVSNDNIIKFSKYMNFSKKES